MAERITDGDFVNNFLFWDPRTTCEPGNWEIGTGENPYHHVWFYATGNGRFTWISQMVDFTDVNRLTFDAKFIPQVWCSPAQCEVWIGNRLIYSHTLDDYAWTHFDLDVTGFDGSLELQFIATAHDCSALCNIAHVSAIGADIPIPELYPMNSFWSCEGDRP